MKYLKNNLIIISIITVAILLRFINLASIPVGFNDDEAAFGYNAYSILKTGMDEWGRFLPFPAFESFGDWKLVVYLYLTAISQFFFGMNEFATRFPSALFGVFAVFATYLLTKKLFEDRSGWQLWEGSRQRGASIWNQSKITNLHKASTGGKETTDRTRNEVIALVAAFLLAISPWHIAASRNAFESDLLVFFITISTYFFLVGLKNKKFITFSFLCFVISFYVYRSAWVFLPLFISVVIYSFRQQFKIPKVYLAKNLILAFILFLPLLPTVLTFKGQSRFLQESFISGVARAGINADINERRGVCKEHLPNIFCTLTYNKFLTFASTYISNYAGNLSFKTYFDKANPSGFQSFSTRSVVYLFELPFLILGIYLLIKQKNQALKILIPWLLFVPIGASFAGSGNYGRINLIMPSLEIIVAFGIYTFVASLKSKFFKNIFIIVLTITILGSVVKLIPDMFYSEPYFTSRFQRFGYKELFNYLASKEQEYDKIVISRKIDYGHQYMQYLYFAKVNPAYFIQNAQRHKSQDGWVILDSIGKYDFVDSVPGIDRLPTKTLIVAGEKEIEFPKPPIYTIDDLRGDTIFEIYDVSQVKLP